MSPRTCISHTSTSYVHSAFIMTTGHSCWSTCCSPDVAKLLTQKGCRYPSAFVALPQVMEAAFDTTKVAVTRTVSLLPQTNKRETLCSEPLALLVNRSKCQSQTLSIKKKRVCELYCWDVQHVISGEIP